jgi:hypothetical protein
MLGHSGVLAGDCFFWRAHLSIKQPLTAHDPIHPRVSSRHDPQWAATLWFNSRNGPDSRGSVRLRGIVSGSCVTPAADCGVRRVLSRRRNLSQLGDQPIVERGTILLLRQRRPCVVQPGVVSITRGSRKVRQVVCLCNVDSRVSQLYRYSCALRNF